MADWGNATGRGGDADTTEESLLLDRLNRIRTNALGYFVVHVHLSTLRPNNKQSHFIEIAARSFDTIVDNRDATLFTLTNKDMVLICRDVPVDDVDTLLKRVRGLFSEDPLTELDEDSFEGRFSTWYDLSNSEDFADFFSVITQLAVEAEQRLAELACQRDSEQQKGSPLQPGNLADINRKMAAIRVADMIKRQACLKVSQGGGGELVFYELFVSINEVRDRVAPDINLFASPWLFQYLTETLDRRLLAVLVEEDFGELQDALSINLNISTVFSRDFHNLHRAVGENARKIVVEFQIIDIFADMKNYVYARDSLQERGYRVVVDGLNPLSLQYFEPAGLKSDFIKISWGPEFTGDEEDRRMNEVREVIAAAGKDTMILSRVDSEKVVKWGLGLGVSRFQGFFIDKLVQVIGRGKRQPTNAPQAKRA
jgi:EAL domain-containing protein (putative c-di-GMP-specific phosphodiesterase class I)